MILPRTTESKPTPALLPNVILGLSIGLPLIALLAIVMAAVHCILKRHRKKLEEKWNVRAWPQQILPRPVLSPQMGTYPTRNPISPVGAPPVGAPLGRSWTQPAPLQLPRPSYPERNATVGHGHARNFSAGAAQTYDPVNHRTIYLG